MDGYEDYGTPHLPSRECWTFITSTNVLCVKRFTGRGIMPHLCVIFSFTTSRRIRVSLRRAGLAVESWERCDAVVDFMFATASMGAESCVMTGEHA